MKCDPNTLKSVDDMEQQDINAHVPSNLEPIKLYDSNAFSIVLWTNDLFIIPFYGFSWSCNKPKSKIT